MSRKDFHSSYAIKSSNDSVEIKEGNNDKEILVDLVWNTVLQ